MSSLTIAMVGNLAKNRGEKILAMFGKAPEGHLHQDIPPTSVTTWELNGNGRLAAVQVML